MHNNIHKLDQIETILLFNNNVKNDLSNDSVVYFIFINETNRDLLVFDKRYFFCTRLVN